MVIWGRRFLSWWWGEISHFLATSALPSPERWIATLVVDHREDGLHLARRKGGALQDLGRIGTELSVEQAQAVAAGLRRQARTSAAILRFSADRGLRRMITLPAQAKDRLRQILAFEMDRLTPWPAESVYFGAEIVERPGPGGNIRVRLHVLPRSTVDPVLERLRQWAIKPGAVELVEEPGSGGKPANLLAPDQRPHLFGPYHGTVRLVGGLIAALWLGSAVLAYAQFREVEHQKEHLAALKREAETVGRLRDEAARLGEKEHYLSRLRAEARPMALTLNRLSELMPDGVWLFELHLSQKEASLSGYAKDASTIIPLIEQAHGFTDVKFLSPVIRDPTTEAERFQLSATIAHQQGGQP